MNHKKIYVPSVKDSFVEALEEQILSGNLEIGEKLPPAKQLCELFGVSLMTVNSGISELVTKGFLEVKPRRGTYVANYKENGNAQTFISILSYKKSNFSSHYVRSFCESRVCTDPFMVELVIQRASDEAIRELEPMLIEFENETDVTKMAELITDFYANLYRLSENTYFYLLLRSCAEPPKNMYAMYFNKNGVEYAKSGTRAAYEAILHRDAKTAKQLVMEMMSSSITGDTSIL